LEASEGRIVTRGKRLEKVVAGGLIWGSCWAYLGMKGGTPSGGGEKIAAVTVFMGRHS